MDTNQHPTYGNGKICYIEMPALDINQSALFYKNVFSWQVRNRSDGSIAFDDAVGEVSGTWVLGLKPATEPTLLIYIMVSDMHSTMEAITTNGGKITEPVGRYAPEITAKFSDPAGNIFGLYQQPS
jgi:predicted enzyme related to lactoylglutathione lyase